MRVNAARGDDWAVAIDRVNYTAAILRAEGAVTAAARLAEWVPAMEAFGSTELIIDVLELGGAIAAELGSAIAAELAKAGLAARLLAAADVRRSRVGVPRTATEAGRVAEWVTVAQGSLSVEDWRTAYESGTAIEAGQVMELLRSIAPREVNR